MKIKLRLSTLESRENPSIVVADTVALVAQPVDAVVVTAPPVAAPVSVATPVVTPPGEFVGPPLPPSMIMGPPAPTYALPPLLMPDPFGGSPIYANQPPLVRVPAPPMTPVPGVPSGPIGY